MVKWSGEIAGALMYLHTRESIFRFSGKSARASPLVLASQRKIILHSIHLLAQGAFTFSHAGYIRTHHPIERLHRNNACLPNPHQIAPILYELISTSPSASFFSSPLLFLAVDFLSKIAFRSASSFKLVMTTLEGWTPIWTVAPLDRSLVTRSMWMTHFFR